MVAPPKAIHRIWLRATPSDRRYLTINDPTDTMEDAKASTKPAPIINPSRPSTSASADRISCVLHGFPEIAAATADIVMARPLHTPTHFQRGLGGCPVGKRRKPRVRESQIAGYTVQNRKWIAMADGRGSCDGLRSRNASYDTPALSPARTQAAAAPAM